MAQNLTSLSPFSGGILGGYNTAATTPAVAAKPLAPAPVSASNVKLGGSTQPAVTPTPAQTPSVKPAAPAPLAAAPLSPTQTAPIAAAPAPTGPTFSGLVGSLANASGAGSQAISPYTGLLTSYAKGSTDVGKQAADIAAQYGQRIADVGGQGARFQAGQLTTGTTPVAEGNAAVTAQTTAAQQAALAAGEQAALQGTAQQLTGFNQAANAANQAASQALGGTGQAITGFGTAAGLAQPNLGGIGQVPYSPLTLEQGSPLGAPGGSAADAARIAGQFQGAQAAAAAPGQTQATIYGTQQQQIAAYQSAHQQAQNLQSQLGDLITSFGLNPSDLTAANAGIQYIATHTSDPRYQALFNYLADITSRYSQVLTPVGGNPTDTTREVASSMINGLASGTSIQAVLQSLDQQAQAVIAGVPTQGGNLGGGSSGGGGFAETW